MGSAVMICDHCKKSKLSNEFPYVHLTDECSEHPLLHCLRCVTASVRDNQKCSQCNVHVEEDNEQYKEYVRTLEYLFPTLSDDNDDDDGNTTNQYRSSRAESSSLVFISTLSGESISLVYCPDQTIIDLKDIIEEKLETPCKKQYLLYNNTELQVTGQDNETLKLKDYHVQPNSTIYMLVLLYEIPEDYDDVIFELFYGSPESKTNFLDATVLLYSGSEFVEAIDYKSKASKSCPAVKHSGDDYNRLGYHIVNVSIKSIPSDINRLMFALSAWNAPNISQCQDISLKFFDARYPDRQLCDDKIENIAYSEAIIMCCLTSRGGKWRVVSLKRPSAGNAKNYEPLKNSIVDLIRLEKGLML